MRTTLKRGMGRAAAVNGNGRAVYPPAVLAQVVGAPVSRYRQPGPPPRTLGGTILRIFGWILLALVVVASGIAGGLYLWSHETLGALGAHSKQGIATSKDKNLQAIASSSATTRARARTRLPASSRAPTRSC
jgi:hypothetical protein